MRGMILSLHMAVILSTGSTTGCTGKPVSMAQKQDAQTTHAPATTEFDGQRAYDHVRRLVELGPRAVNSQAHQKAQEYVIGELRKLNLDVERDEFTGHTPNGARKMTNLIGRLSGRTKDVIVIASHYDTKLFHDFTFLGANDGGSSTGALLEIARVLAGWKDSERPQVWFVFFDGEEAVVDWTAEDSKYGSRHLAERWEKEGVLRTIKALILLDMIGDKDLDIRRDAYSTRSLVDLVWQKAAEIGYGQYFLAESNFIDDDHVPFLRKGVPAIDIIDFNYGFFNRHWHSSADTLEKLSAESLKIVGDVVLSSLPAIEGLPARTR